MNGKLTRRHFLHVGAGTIGAATLAACAPKTAPTTAPKQEPTTKPAEQATSVSPTQAPAVPEATSTPDANWGLEEITRLSETKAEFSAWSVPMYNPVADIKSFNDQVFFKKMEELTNVRLNWQHGSADPNVDALALLMAGGDLPDFICGIPLEAAALYGTRGALEPLNDLLACCAPHFSKLAAQYPELTGSLTAVDGKIYAFPRAFTSRIVAVFAGFIIRQDWLDEVGMPVPETTDAYYETLKAFKDKDPNRFPFTWDPRALIWQWGVGSQGPNCATDFYRDGGVVKYGPVQPEYREALVYISKLYREGLLDPEYQQTLDKPDFLQTRMTTGISGAMLGYGGTHLSGYLQVLKGNDPKAKLIGTFPPKGPGGHQYVLSNHGLVDASQGGAIARSCKQKELLVRYIDLYYSESGIKLMHWGVNGDTFTIVDGKRQLVDKVLKNPNLSPMEYLWNYVSPYWIGPMVGDAEGHQAVSDPIVWEARTLWTGVSDAIKLPLLYFTPEEQDITKARMGDINTLVAESVNAFITGKKTLDRDYNDFVANIQSMGISDVIAVYQAAYDRFQAGTKG